MNIFLDTTQKEFVACLFDETFNVKFKKIKTTNHKVEEIPIFFNYLLTIQKINIHDIKNFYINVGPGSFTGSRISLIYVRTISQITNAKIFTTNSFKLLENQEDKKLFISANKNHSFVILKNDIQDISKTKLVEKSSKEKSIDYSNLITNFKEHLNLFILEIDVLKIRPEYCSAPQIGNLK